MIKDSVYVYRELSELAPDKLAAVELFIEKLSRQAEADKRNEEPFSAALVIERAKKRDESN